MAVLTQDDVRAIADYATIALDETELTAMTSYLNDAVAMLKPILDYAAEDVEPTFHPGGGAKSHLRRDLKKCLDIRLARIAGGQRRAGHLDGADLSSAHTRCDIRGGEGIDESRH